MFVLFRFRRTAAPAHKYCQLPNSKMLIAALVGIACFVQSGSSLDAWQKVSEPTTTKRYQEFVSKIMTSTDKNKDGLLDVEEQQANYRRLFDNADSDGDGSISPQEILDKVSTGKSWEPTSKAAGKESGASSEKKQHNSWRVKTSVLRLPKSFAEKQILSLSDIFQKMSIEQFKEKIEEEQQQGVTVIDQFEMEVLENKKSKLQLGGSASMLVRRWHNKNGKISEEHRNIAYGSEISLKPRNTNNGVLLEFDYNANLVLPAEADKPDAADLLAAGSYDSSVKLQLNSEYRFEEKNATAVNIYSGGLHILLVINIEPL